FQLSAELPVLVYDGGSDHVQD
ncbi:MAG: hypothetical protein H6Q25_1547, partial [Bacteroidetes bacterium]|nr:hypothetical protein [Bacteroidota bacterium]